MTVYCKTVSNMLLASKTLTLQHMKGGMLMLQI